MPDRTSAGRWRCGFGGGIGEVGDDVPLTIDDMLAEAAARDGSTGQRAAADI